MTATGRPAPGRAAQELLRARASILDLVPDAVFTTDPGTGRLLYVNEAACRILGRSRAALLRMNSFELRPELTEEERHAFVEDLTRHPGTTRRLTDIALLARDGRRVECESHTTLVTLESGPVVVNVVRDLRERLRLGDRLRESEASFRTVFDQAPVGALVAHVDRDGRRRIARANSALARLLGEPVEALIGGDLSRFADPRDVHQALAELREVAAGRAPESSGVWRFRAADGSLRWLDMRLVPVRLPDLAGPLVLVYLVDVTEQQLAIERLAVSEASFRTVFERSPIAAMVVRLDADRPRPVRANRAAARLFGDTVEGLLAAGRPGAASPGEPPGPDGPASGPDLPARFPATRRFRRRDGSTFWAELHAASIRLPDLPGPLALVHLVDVSERRCAEVRRALTGAVDQLIARVVTAVLGDQPLDGTYRQVADGVAEVFCAAHASLVLSDPATGHLAVAGVHGPDVLGPDPDGPPVTQEFVTWLTRRHDGGVVVPATAPGLSPERTARLGSMAATPFGAPPTGGVLLAARTDGEPAFTAEEVDLLASLARQLTLAIRLGRTQSEQRRQAAERDAYLKRLEKALRPLSDARRVQAVACRLLGERLGVARVLYADVDEEGFAAVRQECLDGGGIVTPLVKGGVLTAALVVHPARPRVWTELELQLSRDTAERTWAAVQRALAEQASADERARRRAAERELVERAAREQRERLEQEFITNAAHELRTPLTGILAAVDALEAGAADDAPQRHRFLRHLRRESVRLARLSDSLLLLAQAQSVGPPPGEPFAIADLLRAVAGGLHVADTVTVGVEADPRLILHANAGLTEVLVGNLAANAAGCTSAGHVRLSARAEDGVVVVEVDDTGPGMDELTLSRARDRFYRHAVSRDGRGFGLGLSIAGQAAAAMGASLDLRSAPGAGTRARVVFPPPDRGSTGIPVRCTEHHENAPR